VRAESDPFFFAERIQLGVVCIEELPPMPSQVVNEHGAGCDEMQVLLALF
jgi:hypothetical protein